MRPRLLFALLLVAPGSVALTSRVCRAAPAPAAPAPAPVVDEESEFEKGRNAYRAQKYDEADARFLQMLDPEHGTLHDKVLVKQARMYWAATRLALRQKEDATRLFEIILTEDHDYEPDPLAFPTEVVNAFIDTKAHLHEKLEAIAREGYRLAAERRAREEEARTREAARIKMLEKLAGEALVTEKHSRWIALLPFGIGQFQNGQRTAGWFFLAAESTLAAAGVVTVPIYYVDLADAHSTYTGNGAVAQEYLDRANLARDVNLACYGALALTVIVGAIQAEVAFVPSPTAIEPRAVPELTSPPPPAPSHGLSSLPFSFGAAPLAGRDGEGMRGGMLSIGGTF